MSTRESLTPETIKETVRRHWSNRAPTFDDTPSHGLLTDEQRMAWLDKLASWAPGHPMDVLDVGCGTGFLALLLAQLGHRAVGIDVSDEMLALAREKAKRGGLSVDFQNMDAEATALPETAFDLVVERHVIWTLPEPHSALAEWQRVLRPGGRLVLIEGDWRSTPHPDYVDIKDSLPLYGGRPAPELVAIVEASEYVNVTVEPLMEGALWGSPPERERYAVHAWKPSAA